MINKGHVAPWWDNEHTLLDYLYLPHKDQQMVQTWEQQGYANMNLNGAVYAQNREMPAWALKFTELFDWQNSTVSLYCMNTGDILPVHSDHYFGYKKMFGITNAQDIARAIVFLEDWKSGHYIEIDAHPIVNWKKGDYVWWCGDTPHMAYNMGLAPRYTTQITGTIK